MDMNPPPLPDAALDLGAPTEIAAKRAAFLALDRARAMAVLASIQSQLSQRVSLVEIVARSGDSIE